MHVTLFQVKSHFLSLNLSFVWEQHNLQTSGGGTRTSNLLVGSQPVLLDVATVGCLHIVSTSKCVFRWSVNDPCRCITNINICIKRTSIWISGLAVRFLNILYCCSVRCALCGCLFLEQGKQPTALFCPDKEVRPEKRRLLLPECCFLTMLLKHRAGEEHTVQQPPKYSEIINILLYYYMKPSRYFCIEY